MPCQYYESPAELAQKAEEREARRKKALDELTAEADELREYIIAVHEGRAAALSPEALAKITKSQIDHRKMDLRRLEDVFTKSKDAARLAKVWAADPKKELSAQLGFEPDDF